VFRLGHFFVTGDHRNPLEPKREARRTRLDSINLVWELHMAKAGPVNPDEDPSDIPAQSGLTPREWHSPVVFFMGSRYFV